MKRSSLVSRLDSLMCPHCEVGKLRPFSNDSMRCDACGERLSGPMLEALRQITVLPDASGTHACECGHPEMRSLPDWTYHCPSCGSEVLPIKASASRAVTDRDVRSTLRKEKEEH
jgi:ribosomal protein L37AE/L43A